MTAKSDIDLEIYILRCGFFDLDLELWLDMRILWITFRNRDWHVDVLIYIPEYGLRCGFFNLGPKVWIGMWIVSYKLSFDLEAEICIEI